MRGRLGCRLVYWLWLWCGLRHRLRNGLRHSWRHGLGLRITFKLRLKTKHFTLIRIALKRYEQPPYKILIAGSDPDRPFCRYKVELSLFQGAFTVIVSQGECKQVSCIEIIILAAIQPPCQTYRHRIAQRTHQILIMFHTAFSI